MPDIFDEIAPETSAGGDIFDQVAPSLTKPRPAPPELTPIPMTTRILSGLHTGISQGLATPGRLVHGAADLALGAVGAGNTAPARWNADMLKQYADYENRMQAQDVQTFGPNDIPNQLASGTGRAVTELPLYITPGLAAAAPAQAVTRSAIAGGVVGGGTQYAQDRGEGRGRLDAASYAAVSGTITALTTRAFGASGAEAIFRKEGVQGIRNRLVAVLKDAGLEGAEEMADQAQQDLLERYARNPEKPLDATLKEVLMAGAIGSLVGGTVGTAAQGIEALGNPNRPALDAATAEFNARNETKPDIFDQVSSETQLPSPETASNSRPPAAVATPAPAGASPGDALTQEIAGNVVPPSAKRVDDATGQPIQQVAKQVEDLKTMVANLEATLKGNQLAPKEQSQPANDDGDLGPVLKGGEQNGKEVQRQGEGRPPVVSADQPTAAGSVQPTLPLATSSQVDITEAEKTELEALRKKDKSELLEGLEEQRMYELNRKESATKRRSKTASEAESLKEAGITVPESFLNPEPGTETHITGWTKDKNGFIQIRTETHKGGMVSTRLTTLKSGDTLRAGMDDSIKGTSRYDESTSDQPSSPPAKPDVFDQVAPEPSAISPQSVHNPALDKPAKVKKAKPNLMNQPPPGGWTDADKVPASVGENIDNVEARIGIAMGLRPTDANGNYVGGQSTARLKNGQVVKLDNRTGKIIQVTRPDTNPETRAKIEAEIAARESGEAPVKVTPQIVPAAKPAPPETAITEGDWVEYEDSYGKTHQGKVDAIYSTAAMIPTRSGVQVRGKRTEYGIVDASGKAMIGPKEGTTPRKVQQGNDDQPAKPQQNQGDNQAKAGVTVTPADVTVTPADVTVTAGNQQPGVAPKGDTSESDAKIAAIRAKREEIKARLRAKLGQFNAGVDPEVATIAAELAVNYTQEGIVRFADFAKAVKAELPDIWDALRQYLRGAWTTAADMNDGIEEVTREQAKAVFDSIDKTAPEAESKASDERPVSQRERSVEPDGTERPSGERGPAGTTGDGQSGSDESRPSESVASGRQSDTESDRNAGSGGRSASSVPAGEAGQPDDAGVSAARNKRDLRRAQSEPVTSPRNYVITDADQLGKGSLKTKAKDNLAAIRLVKLLESEQRLPTTAEQAKLVRYVGWGGLKGIFDQNNKTYAKEFQELRELLTPEEYEAARASVQDAHYTSQTVIQRGIYAAMRRMGFTGGKMVEGGVGIGNFIGLMPAELRDKSSYLGVERDPLTAKIAQYLYPEAKILSMGYQDADLTRDSFDGGVGNPPFGNKAIFDKNFKASSEHTIHNYFIAKTLETIRPGGVAGFVVSRYFLDTANSAAREHIATLGEFLGAIRLPNTAFKENANTEVVTDLVFFKRIDADTKVLWNWTGVVDFKDPKSGLSWKVNQWIAEHPDMVLGEMTQAKHGLYSKEEMSVLPRDNQDLGADLDKAIENLPQNVYEVNSRKTSERLTTPENTTTDTNGAKVGGFFVAKDGTLMKRLPDVNAEQQSAPVTEMKDGTKDRVKAIIPIRDALNQLVRAELSPDSTGKEIESHRAALNKAYDAFSKKFGFLNSPTNRRAFYDDADSMRVLGLEREYNPGISADTAKKKGVDAIKPSAKKADIFTKRVNAPYREITQVDTPKEALMASLNQRGGVDVDYMAEITGMDKAAVLEALDGLVFENPKGGYESKEEYLSGNVRQKFNEARDAALDDPKYQKNADALKAVIPKDIDPTDIIAPVGAPWVSAKDVEDFADELTGRPPIAVSYMKSNGGWMFNHYDGSEASTQKWGTPRLPFGDLFKLMLNGKPVVVYDSETNEKGNEVRVVNQEQTELANAKAAEIKDKWQDWLWRDKERRDRLHRVYNDNYNNYVEFRADGGHLTLPGASPLITLNPHQKNVVWRTVTAGGKGLLYDHVVGAGKTFAGVASMMELRRLGRVRKWLVTVPNHLTGQWADAFSILYPNSNVLAAKPSDFTKENRQKLFAKILTGDFDAVVLGHTNLKKIGTSPEVEKSILKEMLDEIVQTIKEMKDAAGKGSGTRAISQMEKTKDNLQAKLDRLANIGDRDTVASFEELGFDGLFLDEAHEFKNLFYTTQMQNVAGLGNPTGSAKAFDLYLKTRYLRQQYGGNAPIVFATGTPISNSLVEMFTMQRYLQPNVLSDMGLKTLDAWGKVFADVRAVYEVDPTGTGYRMATRLANFQNVGELTAIYKNMADVITMNDLQAQAEAAGKRFPVPKVDGGKPDNIVAERTAEQAEFFGIETQELDGDGNPKYDTEGNPITSYPKGTILWRVDNMPDDPREDNMLKLTNDARKAGLDMRLINPNAPDRPTSKINKAVKEIERIYRKWDKDKGTQLVFCDLSVPSSAKGKATKKAKGGDLGYYIRNAKTGELTAVEGKPVKLENGGDFEFFIRKSNSGQWVLSERTSGLGFGAMGGTQAATIADAEKILQRVGLDKLKEAVEKAQPTADQLAELAAAKPEPEAKADEADDNAEDTGEQGVSVDELLAEQSSFSVYDDMRDKLLKAGIPANQIAFIHDYDTPEKKMKLFKAMNAGDVRILFGSTPKLGAGTNVQKRLVALHHMDAPWRPSDLEQREGRAIRQGNQFYEEAIKGYKSPQDYDKDPKAFAVEIKRYATALTYDTRMWQLIEHKANGIEGFRRADRTTRTIEDIGGEATNASDMKAAASGDPAIQQEIQLRNDRKRLELLRNAWNKNRIELQNREAFLKDYDLRYQSAVDAAQSQIEKRDKNTKRDKKGELVFEFTMPNGKVATEKGLPIAYMADMLKEGNRGYLGKYRGFDFSFEPRKSGETMSVTIYNGKNSFDFKNQVTVFLGDDKLTGVGLVQRLDNYLKSFETDIKQAGIRRDNDKQSLASVKEEAAKPFSKADDLTRISQEHETVKSQLINKKKKPAALPKTDIVDKLEALKDKSPPKMMGAWIPGLDPESFRAIRNTALDIAIAAIKAGRAVREAVREAINQLKAKYQGIDEAAAIADLEAELRVNQSPSDWRTIQQQYEDAEEELRQAISQHMNPPAGMRKAEARDIKNRATAKLRNIRHDLLRNPAYAEHMILRERQVWQQLKALLEPTGIKPSPDGLLGREDRIREVLTDVEVRRVVDLNREWEQARQEIEAMPKKLVGAISNRLYPAQGTTKTDLELPSEWLQSQLGDQSPVTEPTDITTTADRLRDTVAALPDSLRDTWRASGKAVKAVWAKAQTMENRDIVSATKDAADNKAQILSRQAANVVLHEMNRAFGVPIDTRNADREAALTFAIEAGDKGTLDLMRETILGSEHARTKWGREAVAAIGYAEKHWDRFENVVTLYNRVTNAQAAAEQSSGIKTLMRDGGYVFHLQDVLENWAHLDMTGGTGGAATPFKNIRDYATYADSIANGLNPKTLNAVDLLQRRISLGQKLINYRGWQESLKAIIDPATNQPLGADVVIRVRADGSETETAPVGYKLVRFAGQPYAIHRAYSGLFSALTADSGWRQGAGWHTLMKAATTAKHTMLMFDTFHLGRLAFWSAVTRGAGSGPMTLLPGNPASYRQGLTLLDSTIADLRKMAAAGELTEEQAKNLIESKATLMKLLNAGLNVGSVGDNIYSDWVQKLPLVGQFNRWLFEKYQRGAMTEVALIEFGRVQRGNPELSDEAVARKVAKAVNIRFGNLNSQAWIKSRHAQDLARLVFLAPQWNESLIRSEIEAIKDVGVFLRNVPQGKLKVGTLGRAVATAFIGQFIANQLINWFFRDKPTWENEEEGFEAKISAFIPDYVGNSKGYFLNPMTLPAEITHLILKGHARSGRWDQALVDAIKSRFSSFGRFADVFIEGKNAVGERATGLVDRLALAAEDSAPFPIGANAPSRMIASKIAGESKEQYPGQFQRQIMQTFGIKPDSVPNPEQRIRRLAREYNAANGKMDSIEFAKSDYADLDNAIRVGNMSKARAALKLLLENHDAEAIKRRYELRLVGRFTGSAERETKFVRSLNPEQRQQYDEAMKERRRIKVAVEKLLTEVTARGRK